MVLGGLAMLTNLFLLYTSGHLADYGLSDQTSARPQRDTEPMTVRTPIESRRGLPPWALGFTVFVLLVGLVYFASNVSGTNPPIAGNPSASPGSGGGTAAAMAIIDQVGCKSCHGPDLAGQGIFPDLHGLQTDQPRTTSSSLGRITPTTG